VSVPHDVREAAVAAFSARRPDAEVLELTYDSYVDDPRPDDSSEDHRMLLFRGHGREVRVEVVYEPALTDVQVDVDPAERVEVQVLTLAPRQRLCVCGMPPVRLSTTRRGPVAVSVAPGDGKHARVAWQTSWVPL
jgi:hypothetical protein